VPETPFTFLSGTVVQLQLLKLLLFDNFYQEGKAFLASSCTKSHPSFARAHHQIVRHKRIRTEVC